MRKRFPEAEIVKDIGSGLNFKRKGLKTVLERAMQGERLKVVAAHRDRLSRFGFDLIKWIVERSAGEVVVLDKTELSPEQELTKDLLSILHVFSARLHGLRSYKDKVKQALSDKGAA
jgi:predicted site-specific integrase-resolvase